MQIIGTLSIKIDKTNIVGQRPSQKNLKIQTLTLNYKFRKNLKNSK